MYKTCTELIILTV